MAILAPPPPSHSLPFLLQHRQLHHPPHPLIKSPSKFTNIAHLSSPTTPAPLVTAEDEDSHPPPAATPAAAGGCVTCGREEVERGCNGEGRIQGGIATVPGFGWWPIKAYRPCPGFVASGGRYRRQGQSMDEVASGRGRRRDVPSKIIEAAAEDGGVKARASKKSQG